MIKENGLCIKKKTSSGQYPTETMTDANYAGIRGIFFFFTNTPDKVKQDFFRDVAASVLLYGYTMWTLTKHIKKNLDRNYTRMLCVVLNKSRKQHSTKMQLYRHFVSFHKPSILDMLENQGPTHKWRFPIDSDIWKHQCWPTCKELHTSVLCRC